jgi:hypothetical protein
MAKNIRRLQQFIVRPFTTRIEAEGAVVVAGVDAK